MRVASQEFADDPCSSVKRGTMVEDALEAVKNANNEQDLANRFKEFGKEMVKLNYVAARRQQQYITHTTISHSEKMPSLSQESLYSQPGVGTES
ncbi:hypothetical protein DPEC_G00134700 [Dallia pectoralis]|uniref:Uncharacterized protein n=1 Tax=Dallia pectoralis TaxID=75939 RepID=A0ACC2GRK0_DALPE|nr:hypothetical protein DPEC_G00134700 [Dallia pectoralis]